MVMSYMKELPACLEWPIAKQVVLAQHYLRQSTTQLWQFITYHNRDMFPNLTKLAAFALAHPVHTSDGERSFSVPNQVTIALRNHLDSEHCEHVMRLKIEGGHVDIDCAACPKGVEKGKENIFQKMLKLKFQQLKSFFMRLYYIVIKLK